MPPARGSSTFLRAGMLLAVFAWGVPAVAQERPHLRPKPLPPATSDLTNGLSDSNSVGTPDVPGAPKPPVAVVSKPAPPALVLKSAVHSRYSRPATIAHSTAGQCRAQCSETRTRCTTDQGDTSFCDSSWTQCLSGCEGLTYSRGP